MITLTNVGTAYDTTAAAKALGMWRVPMDGVTQLVLDVYYNKIGTGTVTFQLWNVTNNTELGVINDAAAAGERTVSGTFNINLTGEKVLRLRVKSTVAGDDPVYYSSSLLAK